MRFVNKLRRGSALQFPEDSHLLQVQLEATRLPDLPLTTRSPEILPPFGDGKSLNPCKKKLSIVSGIEFK